jgi:hypothetical protein
MGADGALNIRKWNVTAWVFCAPNTTSTIATRSPAISFSQLILISLQLIISVPQAEPGHATAGSFGPSRQLTE